MARRSRLQQDAPLSLSSSSVGCFFFFLRTCFVLCSLLGDRRHCFLLAVESGCAVFFFGRSLVLRFLLLGEQRPRIGPLSASSRPPLPVNALSPLPARDSSAGAGVRGWRLAGAAVPHARGWLLSRGGSAPARCPFARPPPRAGDSLSDLDSNEAAVSCRRPPARGRMGAAPALPQLAHPPLLLLPR